MAQTNPRILLIDDEIDCLDQLKSSLSSKEEHWIIELSNNPRQSLEAIQSSPPTVLVCDYRMPQMDGCELLSLVEKEHPSVHRFIMADKRDQELLATGIGSSFHFLPKPCSPKLLRSEIQRCIAIENWLGKDQINRIMDKMGDLPSLPSMYQKVVNALNSTDASIENVGQEISTDMAISGKILQIVNSSYFGFEETVSDISQAVTVLGIETVKNLVLAIQVFDQDESSEQKSLTDQLWRHSMSVATIAKDITRHETGNSRNAEEAYTAGLFHDIGKLMMQRAIPDVYQAAREHAEKKRLPFWKAENEIIGCNHAETGAYLLGRWGLPISVVECAACHHEPVNSFGAAFSPLASVHAANALVWENHTGGNVHPDSTRDKRFFAELKKENQWSVWRQIANGKEIEEESSPTSPNASETFQNQEQPVISNESLPPVQTLETAMEPEISDNTTISVPPISNRTQSSFADWSANEKEPNNSRSKIVFAAFCVAACVAFALFLFRNNDDSRDLIHEIANWEEGTFDTATVILNSVEYDDEKGPNEAIVPQALIQNPDTDTNELKTVPADSVAANSAEDSANLDYEEFDTITVEELIAESIEATVDLFPKIQLTGIFYNRQIPAVSVNGKILRVGDDVSGARIVDIRKQDVVIQYDEEKRTFALE